ncbi:diacylglycerol kinase family protein [Micromonospora sp. WMMD1082]|uniref:diacylglycerol/lipid kinase family protein n=1 Tax=Micromonospora sp. WMMD1082 TaxID=3016104 RepID=UPI0024174A11|nr:diacylglycerol kinase family protein [Micromonospora sp. WMMD1082]MDG4792960.1 diacylglycerol kinase family protein [Micromonospora sp. WMMD1082]
MAADEHDPVVCIVNPASGVQRGRTIEQRIAAELPEAQCWSTRHPGHGIALGRQAVEDGYGTVVAVGGDGTLSEVANGMLAAGGEKVRLAYVPAGTCNDFARGRQPVAHLGDLLDRTRDRETDVGTVTFTRPDGTPGHRYFLVSGTVGLISVIGQRFTEKTPVNRVLKRLNLPLAQTASSLGTLARWRPVAVRWELDGEPSHQIVTNLAVLKVPYFAGGLTFGRTQPAQAGYLDAVRVAGVGRIGVVGLMWRVFRGAAAGHPAIHRQEVRTVRIDADSPLPVEVDGEIVGHTPAEFSIHPSCLATVV